MKSKGLLFFIGLVLLIAVFLGGTIVGQSKEGDNEVIDAYYVENTGNIFIGLAKIIDKGAYYIVDVIMTTIEGIFGIGRNKEYSLCGECGSREF